MMQNVRGTAKALLFLLLLVCIPGIVSLGASGDQDLLAPLLQTEADRRAPIDYGFGPGVRPPRVRPGARSLALAPVGRKTAPVAGADAGINGAFDAPVTWPIMPIHMTLLPDGRVMNYGSDALGRQGAAMLYDVWDPLLGSGTDAHLVLPNTTGTDIFCSAQSVIWSTGAVLITGGDVTIGTRRNYSTNATTVFNGASNTIAAAAPMNAARWYASIVDLPDGRFVVLGGRQSLLPTTFATTPELYDPVAGTWITLPGATSNVAFGSPFLAWFYPRAFLAPDGSIFVLTYQGRMYTMSIAGSGSIVPVGLPTLAGSNALPTIMFAPGKLLSVRNNGQVIVIDLNASPPTVTPTGSMSQVRYWSSGTVLADGRVLVTGGSTVLNQLTGVAYQAEIWDPASGVWTLASSEIIPRLYHSNALLLPDGSVVVGGGGAPGPVKNLNAESYYPSYLYNTDGSGTAASRPTLLATPPTAAVGGQLAATVGPADVISRVTFLRSGSATHSINFDQRFFDLPFVQAGQSVTATLPANNNNTLVPGNYLLFVFNQAGVPSVANMVLVPG